MDHNITEHQNFPDVNKLSIVTATILLAYALTPFIEIHIRDLEIQLPTAIFSFSFDYLALVSILVAIMAGVGMDWLARGHPHLIGQNLSQHEILPALTAWVIGIPLSMINFGWQWWIVFAFGGALLILVIIAEYIVVDLSDINYSLASMGLTAVSFALFLFMIIAIRGSELRIYLVFPVVSLVMALISLRTLFIRLNGRWFVSWSIGIALVVGQIGVGLHYMPIRPIDYGLLLMIPAYGLTSIVGGIKEEQPGRTLWIETATMTSLFLVLTIVLGD